MQLSDRLTIDAPRRTADGFLAVRARAARSGVYDYLASEVDAPSTFAATDTVKIYRDPAEVFAKESVASFLAKPITNDHPSVAVNADNWRDHARGTVMGAMKDGEYLAFDLVFMDKSAIAALDSGKRELSNGYSCSLDWTPGTAPDGSTYDARQVGIRGNHVALVDKGRAGPDCAIADSFARCDANPTAISDFNEGKNTVPKIIIVDGLPVDLTDVNAVEALLVKKDAAIAAGQTALDAANAALSVEQGKVTALESQLADAKAASDPAAIDKRVADRSALVAAAKVAFPDVVTDGKSDDEIRAAVVVAKLGDKAPTDSQMIAGAFAVLTADAPAPVVNIAPASTGDASAQAIDSARAKMIADMKGEAPAIAA
jgi:hypothetical protein